VKIESYKDLVVWQKAMNLVDITYRIARQLPDHEKYGLVSQACRSAVSIPSNIAEGQRRKSLKEYLQFLNIANASSGELETQLLIIQRQYPEINILPALELLDEIMRMLPSLLKNLSPQT
jgi:four helix bundle protein